MNNILETPTKVYYLKMLKKPDGIDSSGLPNTAFSKLPTPINTTDYLFYYKTVGEKYNWLDRRLMSDSELHKVINSPKTEIFTYTVSNQVAGFAEFIREDQYTEILYFGLFPDFIGKGLGKDFLKKVIAKAWDNNPEWIQLNTCELDHPNALPTYKKLGFELDKMTVENRKTVKR